MISKLSGKLRFALARFGRPAILIAFLAILSGIGLTLYQVHSTQTILAQGAQPDAPLQIASVLKGNSSQIFGPLTATSGSWLNLRVTSNDSISLQVASSTTGTILNSTGRTFSRIVFLPNSTNYHVTAINQGTSGALLRGNVSLTTLSFTTVITGRTTRPGLWVGLGLVSVGGVSMFYFALPKGPPRRRSVEFLFDWGGGRSSNSNLSDLRGRLKQEKSNDNAQSESLDQLNPERRSP